MVIIMKPGTTKERIDALAHELEVKGLKVASPTASAAPFWVLWVIPPALMPMI